MLYYSKTNQYIEIPSMHARTDTYIQFKECTLTFPHSCYIKITSNVHKFEPLLNYSTGVYFSHGFFKLYFWPLSSAGLKNLLCFLCAYKPKARQSESAYSRTLIWDYEPFINLSSVIVWEPRFRSQWIFHTFISYAISSAQKCVLLRIILCRLFLCVCVSHHMCVWGIRVRHFIWSQHWNVYFVVRMCFYICFLGCKCISVLFSSTAFKGY